MLSSLTLPALQSQYESGEIIGHGDDASVYRAIDPGSGETVAVKVFDQRMELDASFVANFRREARRASLLRHPNVVRTFAYGYADQHYYLTLEYIDGGSLERLIPAPAASAPPEAMQALLHVCAGLEYLHEQGIVHRNLEPSNILLRASGEAVVAGLGPVHQLAGSGLTMTNILAESLQYASPEQLAGGTLTTASDIYSFGLILYQTCTGRLPFDEGNLVQLALQQMNDEPPSPRLFNPSLEVELEAVILRCLQKDPAQRYGSMREVKAAIKAVQPLPDKTLTLMQAVYLGPVDRSDSKRSGGATRAPARAASVPKRFRPRQVNPDTMGDLVRDEARTDVTVSTELHPRELETVHDVPAANRTEEDLFSTGAPAGSWDPDQTVVAVRPIAGPTPVPMRQRAIPVRPGIASSSVSMPRRKRPALARRLIHDLAQRVVEATS